METMKRFSTESQTGFIEVDRFRLKCIKNKKRKKFIVSERIMKSRSAIWPSPKGSWLAYLKLNNSKVSSFFYPNFGSLSFLEDPIKMKYAKVDQIV